MASIESDNRPKYSAKEIVFCVTTSKVTINFTQKPPGLILDNTVFHNVAFYKKLYAIHNNPYTSRYKSFAQPAFFFFLQRTKITFSNCLLKLQIARFLSLFCLNPDDHRIKCCPGIASCCLKPSFNYLAVAAPVFPGRAIGGSGHK